MNVNLNNKLLPISVQKHLSLKGLLFSFLTSHVNALKVFLKHKTRLALIQSHNRALCGFLLATFSFLILALLNRKTVNNPVLLLNSLTLRQPVTFLQ